MWKTISLSLLALTLKATAAIEPGAMRSQLRQSRSAWTEWKEKHGNSYKYGWSTIVQQTQDQIASTVYVDQGRLLGKRACLVKSDGARQALDASDARAEITRTRTMEELYDECENQILPQLDVNPKSVTLELNPEGVLKSCYFVQETCRECGIVGFNIQNMSSGPSASEYTSTAGTGENVCVAVTATAKPVPGKPSPTTQKVIPTP